jgi:hypothetical protein
VKAAAVVSMLASLAWIGLAVRPPVPVLAAAIALVLAGIVFLARIPSGRGWRARARGGEGEDSA